MELELLNNSKPTQTKKISNFGKILIYGTGGVAVTISVICVPFVSPALRKFCLPYVPATSEQLKGVAKALAGRSGNLLDVGSGDGRIVFAAAKSGFKADGVELNAWLVIYSKIKALFSSDKRNLNFYQHDLWKFNMNKYENIVIFGVEQMMCDFERKLVNEVQEGAVVVACRFPLPNIKPVETIGHGVDTVWKYVIKR